MTRFRSGRNGVRPPLGHVLSLGIVAVVCAVASAYVSNTPAAAHHVARQPRTVPAARTEVALARVACRTALRRDRVLAAMVAPDQTVRLAVPLRTTPPLHAGAHVFPLARASAVVDTFGTPRQGVSWHHGDDLFAAKATPVLAVADGVIFSVGWERLGGRRLWVRDRAGNEFYYAHLSAYSRRTRNGELVRAGEVIAFVGNSGDAEGTPPHLHFEVHPSSLLGLGYDGAVDPTPYLRSWRQVPGHQRLLTRPRPPC